MYPLLNNYLSYVVVYKITYRVVQYNNNARTGEHGVSKNESHTRGNSTSEIKVILGEMDF